uniref:Uncharacterized protein n=1 Tax=Acrobeloides nanus TaxID=290746 RepID=A0A914CBF4_9BILA
MILNWAFDTLHTGKTAAFYLSSAAIIGAIVVFGLFNLWQLQVALQYQEYLEGYIESSLSSLAPIHLDSKLKRDSSDFGPTILMVNRNSENMNAPQSADDLNRRENGMEMPRKLDDNSDR